jgi:hypothetical protein
MSRDCTQGQKCYNCEFKTSRNLSYYVLTALQAARSDICLVTARPNPPANEFATSASSPATFRLLAPIERLHDLTTTCRFSTNEKQSLTG